MKTIATINFKGGVGKTTVTWCLGDILSSYSGYNVLLFDLDAQASLTQAMEFGQLDDEFTKWKENSVEKKKTIHSAFKSFLNSDRRFNFQPDADFIYMINDKYHFIPATDDLYWVGLDAIDPERGRVFVRRILEKIRNSSILPGYDYVIFDCPPSFTPLSYSVLTCCDLVLIPTNPDFFAAKGVDLLAKGLQNRIEIHPFPKIAVFANRVKESFKWPNEMSPTYAEKNFINDLKMSCDVARLENGIDMHYLDTYIRARVAVGNAISNRKTPTQHIKEFQKLWEECEAKLP